MMQMTASMVSALTGLTELAAPGLEPAAPRRESRGHARLDSLVRAAPTNGELLRVSAAAALQAGNRDLAADHYRKALAHAPADPRVLRELGRFTEAIAAFRRAVTGGRASIELLVELGATQAIAGKHADALHTLGRVVAIDPTHANAWSQRGNLLTNMGHPGEALACHQRAISLAPGGAFAWLHHGYHLLRQGRPASARDSFARAIVLKPDLAVAWVRQGDALAAMGRWRSAFASYERAVALDGAFLQARLGRARSLAALGYCAASSNVRRAADLSAPYQSTQG